MQNTRSRRIYRKILSIALFLVITFGIMVPLYVHYTARQFIGAYDILYLSEHSPYDTVLIEVHYREGAEPSDGSLNLLRERVENYTGKRVSVVKYRDIGNREIPETVRDDDVADMGRGILKNHTQHRTGWFSGNIVVYIMYIDARWSGETNLSAAGIAYNADSIVIFKEIIPGPELETPVLLHEFGHLWGLTHSNSTDDIMNIHLDEYLISHIFDELPNDFSEKDRVILQEKHASWLVFPVKPYEPLYSLILNHADTIVAR